MNIKILTQNIVNNPSDFTAEQIERYFEDYAELRLAAVMQQIEQLVCKGKCDHGYRDEFGNELFCSIKEKPEN